MIEISINKIKEKARRYYKAGKSWHFHILTPQCQLNESGKFAFILENATDSEVFVNYSQEPQMKVGKELVPLLHGKDVIRKEKDQKKLEPSFEGKKIIKRAKELTSQGKLWHHHMLFPDCIYNDSGKWMILFEDQENKKILKVTSDYEPKNDLQEIETLYYQQKKLK